MKEVLDAVADLDAKVDALHVEVTSGLATLSERSKNQKERMDRADRRAAVAGSGAAAAVVAAWEALKVKLGG
jgi:hypothetical protein